MVIRRRGIKTSHLDRDISHPGVVRPLDKIVFPVHRPGGLISANWLDFFYLSFFFICLHNFKGFLSFSLFPHSFCTEGQNIFKIYKPVFHWISRLRWVPNTTKNETNNMKSTWPMPAPCVGDLTQSIFHLLSLGVCIGGNANFRVRVGGSANFSIFRYQLLRWGHCPTRRPNTSVFAS